MTPTETVELLAYIGARVGSFRIEPYTAAAWHEDLEPYPIEDVREAARTVTLTREFVSIKDLLTEVRKIRERRVAAAVEGGIPDADPDDPQAYIAALRECRYRSASPGELKPRPMAALLAGKVTP